MRLYLGSESDTLALARRIGALLLPGDTVLLKGDLGTGKSVFVRGAARVLGVEGPMPSPTFTLMQCYEGKVSLCHFDLYRLEDAEEFYEAGLEEPLGRDLCFIEWPMDEVDIPAPWIQLELARMNGPTERTLEVQWNGLTEQRAQQLREMLQAWEA